MSSTARSAREIHGWLVHRLADLLGLEAAGVDAREPFASYGLGSREAIGLSGELEDWLGIELPPTLLYEHPTIESLVRALADGGVEAPAPLPEPVVQRDAREPIAIVGIGCRFPGGASSPAAFWRLLSGGVDAIAEVPPERWDAAAFYDPDPQAPGKMSTRWGGWLERVDRFDAGFFGISPREAACMDPQQRLLLEVVWEALEDGGQVPEALAGTSTGVFVGLAGNDYGLRQLGGRSAGDIFAGTGSALSIAANRLSYVLDLHGPSLVLDTACSSSLVAVLFACRSLWSGECPLAIAGGANVILSPWLSVSFSKAGVLAPDGRCKTFDARADGYVRSEGAAAVILKPLSRALADDDPVHAVILGGAVNQDGRSNGLMAPNGKAQEALLAQAYTSAGVVPGAVSYIEAHGIGTELGDLIEARALGAVLGTRREAENACAVGSVKTGIGHLEAASGMAGLIKVALALRERTIPPSLHFTVPNPRIDFAGLGLRVAAAAEPLPGDGPVTAGVSAFGFGGTNAHLVLRTAPDRPRRAPLPESGGEARAFLVPLSARDPRALRDLAAAWRDMVSSEGAPSLADLAYTAGARRSHHEHRLAVVCRSRQELGDRLDAFLRGAPAAESAAGPPFLEEAAALYLAGGAPDWAALAPRGETVRLPLYPWQRERFWLDESDQDEGPEERGEGSSAHLAAEVARVLRLSPGRIDPRVPLRRLGLDSLTAIELKNNLAARLGAMVPISRLLEGATLEDLTRMLPARGLSSVEDGVKDSALPPGPHPREDEAAPFPLSINQKGLWIHHQMTSGEVSGSIATAWRVTSPLDLAALRRALQALVERHPMLRTTYREVEGAPVQITHPAPSAPLELVEAAGWSEERLRREIGDAAHRPFDLERGPLLRAGFFSRPDGGVLLLVAHHLITDLWSFLLLFEDLRALYAAETGGPPVPAPSGAAYRDYVAWQAEMLGGSAGERLWDYWRQQLAGADFDLDLAIARPRPDHPTHRGGLHAFSLGEEASRRLRELADARGVTLFTLLLSAFQVLLHHASGADDLVVVAPTLSRGRAELAGIVGYFVNLVPLRGDLSRNPSFIDLLTRVQGTVLGALEHDALPFPVLLERLGVRRGRRQAFLAAATFDLQRIARLDLERVLVPSGPTLRMRLGDLVLESFPVEPRFTRHELFLLMVDAGSALSGSFQYALDRYDPPTVERLAARFEALLAEIVADPSRPLARLAAGLAAAGEEGKGRREERQRSEVDRLQRLRRRRRGDDRAADDGFAETAAASPAAPSTATEETC